MVNDNSQLSQRPMAFTPCRSRNEPDFASCGKNDPCNGNYDTMLYTANEMVAFVKVAGPKLKPQGVKVIAPETSEWNHQWSNVSAGPDVAGKNSSDPLKCGCFGMTPNNALALHHRGGYDYGHYLAADATAWASFDIIGVHEYDSQIATRGRAMLPRPRKRFG
jgi:O-glycosyl hydrolase